MVSVKKLAVPLTVSELRVHQEARPDWMRVTRSFWKSNPQALRKLLVWHSVNVNVSVKTRAALAIGLNNNLDVRLRWIPMIASAGRAADLAAAKAEYQGLPHKSTAAPQWM